ncbi:3-beta-hydroxysteroid-Delta(8),Delta(7)-isomerase [Plectosphaerella cucumerina]|uniref:3-beta-hydroxysteroid-Delta(8), Delta(7)-isomerase n=1 Tax=Plectosphaerella cucumerina TaxID=40658 RepID=A0A8K0TJI7_9PEZI|nr:3-beta-hydroxysteroid-Delta(8),Delta(7)-isomerase [Plectosphaerella cucumerina]
MATHPFYPLGVAIPNYSANTMSTPVILAWFCGIGATIILPTLAIAKSKRPGIPKSELATAAWFVLCAFIHFFLEGYFALHFDTLAGDMTLLGQMWKEYSLSDSRYLTGDTFVVCMETITAVFWGPLSILCASTIVSESPWRHPLQIVISLGQLYGDVLYYATCTFEEHARATLYSRPERYYFWGYYVLLNAFWIVIPSILLWQSLRSVATVFARVQKLDQGKKGR